MPNFQVTKTKTVNTGGQGSSTGQNGTSESTRTDVKEASTDVSTDVSEGKSGSQTQSQPQTFSISFSLALKNRNPIPQDGIDTAAC